MIKHDVGYNSQLNNYNFKGKFSGWRQCFTTCSWMFMSFYSAYVKAGDDKALSTYFDDVEDSVGKPGIGETVKEKFRWITGKSSYWWLVQKEGIEKWLWKGGVKGNAIFREGTSFLNLYIWLEKGPVILRTKKLGGLKGGHIILAVGYDEETDNVICHDPFGNANTNYSDRKGAYVQYSKDLLRKHCGSKITCMYWR